MSRFFVNQEDIHEGYITITGEDVKHIKNVLRLSQGEKITICDGCGCDYLVCIDRFEPNGIHCTILDSVKNETEAKTRITLFQGLPKSDKMDFIIQKCVELGINRIVPVLTERTIVKIEGKDAAEKKRVRWQKVALEAAKQSNRGIIPEIGLPITFDEMIKCTADLDVCLIAYEKETKCGLKEALQGINKNRIGFVIGPEGGFSEKEIEKTIQSKIQTISLGPRILRTETAGIVALSIIMYELGDL